MRPRSDVPACGVDVTHYKGRGAAPGVGGYISALEEVLAENDLDLPVFGVHDLEMEESVRRVKDFLAEAA